MTINFYLNLFLTFVSVYLTVKQSIFILFRFIIYDRTQIDKNCKRNLFFFLYLILALFTVRLKKSISQFPNHIRQFNKRKHLEITLLTINSLARSDVIKTDKY